MKMPENDAVLYENIGQGDKSALEKLYDQYNKLVFSFAYRMTGNKELAEEVVQEVFMKIWVKPGLYDPSKGKFASWLLTVTRNLSIDLMRKQKEVPYELQEEREKLADDEPTPDEILEWKEKKDILKQAIGHLKENQQEMIHLFYFNGYSQQKIADHFGIPLGTVKGRLRLALQHLRRALDANGERRDLDERA